MRVTGDVDTKAKPRPPGRCSSNPGLRPCYCPQVAGSVSVSCRGDAKCLKCMYNAESECFWSAVVRMVE